MAGALFIIAGIDIPAQLFQRSKRLNMSQQDLKDEYKETEGSPELKGMLRRRQYELLTGSARKAIVNASVVVTNPTHFSVALSSEAHTSELHSLMRTSYPPFCVT